MAPSLEGCERRSLAFQCLWISGALGGDEKSLTRNFDFEPKLPCSVDHFHRCTLALSDLFDRHRRRFSKLLL